MIRMLLTLTFNYEMIKNENRYWIHHIITDSESNYKYGCYRSWFSD